MGEPVTGTDERLLVEYTVAARQQWLGAMDELVQFYSRRSPDSYKAARVQNAISRFDPVRTYMYYGAAEIPGADLRPTSVIPQADTLYDEAYKLYRDGKGITHTFMTTSYDKERQALAKFLELVQKYPNSTKIALSAYFIGEIYKEYFNENLRAVTWYERAWQWDPDISEPARFQAATVYDYRLHQRQKALELYKQVLERERFNKSNVTFSQRRIAELTKQG